MVKDKNPTKPVSKVPKESTLKKPSQKTLKVVKPANQPLNNLINTFEYEIISREIIPPNADDLMVISSLKRLDQFISKSGDSNGCRSLLMETQESCVQAFGMWLTDKGVQNNKDSYTCLSNVYLTFIYGCDHKEPITIKNVCEEYIVEFMMDFVFNRTTLKQVEFTLVPSAMMLFHIYLYEKGYLDDPPDGIVDFMDEMESEFIQILNKRFS